MVHSIGITSKGKTEYPFGKDAIGYIYYVAPASWRYRLVGKPEQRNCRIWLTTIWRTLAAMRSTPKDASFAICS